MRLTVVQKHADVYLTLALIAKDVCAIPATSVPCECLFLGGGEIATDQRSQLGADKFEYLQVLKHAWCSNIADHATTNSSDINEVQLEEFKELLIHEGAIEHELDASDISLVTTE